ncbi:hypothetical protein HC928_22760 [bacterium]|nr:hypothetical protein [bacterium]
MAANAGLGTFVYLLDRFRGVFQAHLEHGWANTRFHSPLLFLATLFSGLELSEAASEARLAALRLSNDESRVILAAMRFHRLPLELHAQAPLDSRSVYRYWRKTEASGLDGCLLAAAYYLHQHQHQLSVPAWTAFLQTLGALLDGYGPYKALVPLVRGDDLMQALGLAPGRQIGELLEALREAQAVGEVSTVEDALGWARARVQP